jgi:hypothetical protein
LGTSAQIRTHPRPSAHIRAQPFTPPLLAKGGLEPN